MVAQGVSAPGSLHRESIPPKSSGKHRSAVWPVRPRSARSWTIIIKSVMQVLGQRATSSCEWSSAAVPPQVRSWGANVSGDAGAVVARGSSWRVGASATSGSGRRGGGYDGSFPECEEACEVQRSGRVEAIDEAGGRSVHGGGRPKLRRSDKRRTVLKGEKAKWSLSEKLNGVSRSLRVELVGLEGRIRLAPRNPAPPHGEAPVAVILVQVRALRGRMRPESVASPTLLRTSGSCSRPPSSAS